MKTSGYRQPPAHPLFSGGLAARTRAASVRLTAPEGRVLGL
jgi:hypothetical protein